uniref:methyltransferase n=1 Tax=Thaumasiovibrio occultus TaxID=1891184 RepID=UPI000B3621BB|nr:methyltransferase [Thaumasiovibrio occultus]
MSTFAVSFEQLTALLLQSRQFWQFMPFQHLSLPWSAQSDFERWLSALSLDDVSALKRSPDLAHHLQPFVPQALALADLADDAQWPLLSLDNDHTPTRGLDTGVPGRKWQQISAFSQGLATLSVPVLEWCAGKGHLGRLIADRLAVPVTSLEWDSALCEQGQQYATQFSLPIEMVCADAFSPQAQTYVHSRQHAVALHACGDLHVTLLRHACAKQTQAVTISPCCYHLIKAPTYQPLSSQGQAAGLVLSKHDLRLPLQETVTAPGRIERLRAVEVSFRLGFDAMQRTLFGNPDYMPLPNIQKALLNDGFASFCQWAADRKGVVLPAGVDFSHWQAVGEQRFEITEKMELVRQLFRRPLELWLVLDRILFLEQNGYQVALRRLCEKAVTPRNYVIHARYNG